MNRKKRARQQPETRLIIAVALIIGVVGAGGLLVAQRFSSGTGLRDTDTTFSLTTHVGQVAPDFTAIAVDGQPYTVTPGDGRPKAIVFYMGFR